MRGNAVLDRCSRKQHSSREPQSEGTGPGSGACHFGGGAGQAKGAASTKDRGGPGSPGSGTARRPLRMELSEREGSVVSAIRGVGRPQILWAPLSRDIQSVVRSY